MQTFAARRHRILCQLDAIRWWKVDSHAIIYCNWITFITLTIAFIASGPPRPLVTEMKYLRFWGSIPLVFNVVQMTSLLPMEMTEHKP